MPFAPSSFVFLVVMPGATSSILATRSDALAPSSFVFLVVMPGATSSILATRSDALAPSSFVFLVLRPGATLVASDRSVQCRDALCY